MTPDLIHAAETGDVQAVRRILEAGADVNTRGNWGVTPLMEAARLGHTEVVRLLLEHGADPLAEDDCHPRSTALLDAIRGRHADAAREISQRIEQQKERDWGLQFATLIGDAATIDALLECGADINATGKHDGRTPMMIAVAQQRQDLMALLLRRGADMNQPHGGTPLMQAVWQRDPVLVEWLIRAGADLTVTDYAGRTALAIAEEIADTRLIELLSREMGRAARDVPP